MQNVFLRMFFFLSDTIIYKITHCEGDWVEKSLLSQDDDFKGRAGGDQEVEDKGCGV